MPRFRFFALLPLPILTASMLLLTGAIAQQAPKGSQSAPAAPAARPAQPPPAAAQPSAPPSVPEPKADPKATETLKKAVKELDPSRLGWIDTKLWQQVDSTGISFEVEGRYRSSPGHCLRLDLEVRLGGTKGQSHLVSDGSWMWRSTQVAETEPKIEKYDLKKIEEVLKSPGIVPQVSDNFYRSQTFQGMVPLLETLSQQMAFTQQESTRWQGHDVFKLTGVWSGEVRKGLGPPQANIPWQVFTPRQCRLYLDQKPPHWLYRVEWLGPTTASGEDHTLMQMEFREPRIFKPTDKLPQDFALAFRFDPGKANVTDRTEFFTTTIQSAGRQSGPGIRPTGDVNRP